MSFDKRGRLVDKAVKQYDISKLEHYTANSWNTKEKEEPRLFELEIVVRAGSIDLIKGLLPHAVNAFMLNDRKLATYANDVSNYSVYLSDHKERQGE